MTPEGRLLAEIREALGREVDVVLWRNNTGMLRNEAGRAVRYGLAVGSADLVGILRPSGRFFALEVKTPDGRISPEQSRWIRLVDSMGGFARVVRSVEQALDALRDAREAQRRDIEDWHLLEATIWQLHEDLGAAQTDVSALRSVISRTGGDA